MAARGASFYRRDFCDLVGMEHPVVQAPMGGAVGPAMAAAVSEAGGLGMIPLWGEELPEVRLLYRQTRSLTARPFGVNLNVAFTDEARLALCLEEGARIVSFFWEEPGPLIAMARDAGAVVLQTVASAADARRAVDAGADAVVAQGWEAGGHVRGTVSTLALVPAVADAVPGTPVVAAGGVSDGRALAAVMALGASAGWVGTRFLAAEETEIHPDYRARLLAASENDTAYFDRLFDIGWEGAPHRVIRNSTVRNWEAAGRPVPGSRPGEGDVLARAGDGSPLHRYEVVTPKPNFTGDIEAMSMWCGQGVAQVKKVQPAREILQEMVAEARAILG